MSATHAVIRARSRAGTALEAFRLIPNMTRAAPLAAAVKELLPLIGDQATDPATVQLAQIRAIFDTFDWQTDDRQYALEQIEDIVMGGGAR
jgi:hypothetical protein